MINALQLSVDFGLVVLIWMVQLIIYPSFLFYKKEDLSKWHIVYTKQIALVVIPLMFVQLGFAIWHIFIEVTLYTITYATMVLFLWIITLLKFAPLHFSIDTKYDKKTLETLVKLNWIRTFVWTFLFTLSLLFLKF